MNLVIYISKIELETHSGNSFCYLYFIFQTHKNMIDRFVNNYSKTFFSCFRWKGENVSTSEVEAVVSNASGYRDTVVYGIEVCMSSMMNCRNIVYIVAIFKLFVAS